MNIQERDLIAQFFARVGGATTGSVPQTASALPPIDPQADQYIGEMFQKYPEARYRITQMAVVQEAALAEAQNRIRQLQWEVQQAQQQLAAAQQTQPQAAQPARPGGFFSGMFGGGGAQQSASRPAAAPPPGWGGGAAPAAPPQPVYPPGMQPGMFPQRGSGFLGSALTTAAGVAGGMMVGNALTGLFSGHHDSDAGFGAGGVPGGGETIINNNYGDSGAGGASADPFAGSGTTADQGFDAGGDNAGGFDDGGGFDAGDDNSF